MATVAGIKIKVKKEKVFSGRSADEKYTGPEPKWDHDRAICMDDAEFDHHLRQSFYYYNYYFSVKDCAKDVFKWARDEGKLKPDVLKRFEKSALAWFPMTACSIIRAHKVGMPLRERERTYLLKCVNDTVEKTRQEYNESVAVAKAEAKSPAAKPLTIQDRIAEKMTSVIAEIDAEVDNVFACKAAEIKIYDHLVISKVPQAQIGKIRARYQRQIDEITMAVEGKDVQLKEGYAHIVKDKKALKRIGDFYVKLLADLDSYTHVKKVQKKVRVKKAPSKEKLIAKVKYAKENKELKIISASPADIIGAAAVWVYNAKLRKLGRYVASEHNVLGIKGTSITNYDEFKSVAKTLRKPAEQLKEFAKAGKVVLRTFLKDIRATETRLNGRLNEDILILKVE
jgi:hypothetical protein